MGLPRVVRVVRAAAAVGGGRREFLACHMFFRWGVVVAGARIGTRIGTLLERGPDFGGGFRVSRQGTCSTAVFPAGKVKTLEE